MGTREGVMDKLQGLTRTNFIVSKKKIFIF